MKAHVMIDLENLGLRQTTVFLSCGLVSFEPTTGEVDVDNAICLYPSVKEQHDRGRTHEKSTMDWWENQTAEARKETFVSLDEQLPLDEFCGTLRHWLNTNTLAHKSRLVWSNGAGFDIPIIENLFESMELGVPWTFWNIRDTRTAWAMANVTSKRGENPVAHSAKHDAIEQAERVCKAYGVLGLQKEKN